MTGLRINLVCCTQTIVAEVASKQITQKHVALTYAMAIKSEHDKADKPDWKAINGAILSRWSMSGLEHIKRRAWKILEGKVSP
jgi:hypothetical protein